MAEPVNIVPGQTLSDEQKKQLANENVEATKRAHDMAQQAMMGDNRPAVEVVAESIADKFKKFNAKEVNPENPEQDQ